MLKLDGLGGINIRDVQNFLLGFFRQGFIQVQYHQCLSAGFLAADIHGADINIYTARDITHRADQPGPVLMVYEEEVAGGGHKINPVVIDPDNMRLPSENSTGNLLCAVAGGYYG